MPKKQKLLSSILSSDLIYFTSDTVNKQNVNKCSHQINVKEKITYNVLNINQFIQSIKQLIRLLQYNSNHYKNFLQIVTTNVLFNDIIAQISNKYCNTEEKISPRNKLDSNLQSKVLLYINFDISKDIQELLLRAFKSNINSIILINTYFNNNILGNYKICTNINNYKKLIFVIILILLAQKNN